MPEMKKKRTAVELLDAIHDSDPELEAIAAMTDEEVAADVAALGGDPSAIAAWGAAFAAKQAERAARLAWQAEARARLERAWASAARAPRTPALPRNELLERIAAAQKSPRFAEPMAAAFRKRKPEEASDDELRALLDEIAALEAIVDDDVLEEAREPRTRDRSALVREPGEAAVNAAERMVAELGLSEPEDIDVALIAAHRGVFVRTAHVPLAQGHLLRVGAVATATVDTRTLRDHEWRFVLAHELGHFVLHPRHDDLPRCTKQRPGRARRRIETEANDFAAELTVPRPMLASWLARQPRTQRDEPGPSLATVRDAASAFATGVDSMALRVLLVTRAPCAVVTIDDGRVAWWAHGEGFAARVGWGHRLDERTVAARLRAGEAGGPELVAPEAWDVGGAGAPIVEEAIAVGDGRVVSWLVEASNLT